MVEAYWVTGSDRRPIPKDESSTYGAYCSHCDKDALEETEEAVLSRFCPHCGAEMLNWRTEEEQEKLDGLWWEDYHRKTEERLSKLTPEEREAHDLYVARCSTGMLNPAEYEAQEAKIKEFETKGYDMSFMGGGKKRSD